MEDFEKWKKANKSEFSLFDYIFGVNHLHHLSSDLFFAYFELCWPTFILYKNHVFLKENFSEERFERLKNEGEHFEYWMNLLLLDPYFETESQAKQFAEKLAESWGQKLIKEFPNRRFVVKSVVDTETGDCGVTFYETL